MIVIDESLAQGGALRDTHATICGEARRHAPGRVLAAVQLDAKEALADFGPMPLNVELAHHNAIEGRDGWGAGVDRAGVAALIVVGRTLPSPASVEHLAEALTGATIDRLPGWYEKTDAARELVNGVMEAAEAHRHPHPIAEAIRWQIAEGELVQIIGRARGVNRTAADPVDVLAMVSTPLPLPIAATLAAGDLTPGPNDFMRAAGGIAFSNPTDAAEFYPGLWRTREAAKKAFERGGWGHSLISAFLLGNAPTLGRIDYQRAGAGRSKAWRSSTRR
jgi:putative DNA primase/helicase